MMREGEGHEESERERRKRQINGGRNSFNEIGKER